jgi:hypothetical protein
MTLGTALKTAGIALAIYGIAKAWDYVAETNQRYIETLKKSVSESDNNIKNYESERDNITSLQQKLEDARGSKEKLLLISEDLNKAIGETPNLLSGESDAYEIANQKIKDRITLLNNQIDTEKNARIANQKEIFNSNKMDIKGFFGITTGTLDMKTASDLLKSYQNQVDSLTKKLETAPKFQQSGLKTQIQNYNDSIALYKEYLLEQAEEAKKIFADSINNTFKDEQSQGIVNKFIESLVVGGNSDLGDIDKKVKAFIPSLQNLNEIVNKISEAKVKGNSTDSFVSQYIQQIEELVKKYPSMKEALDGLKNAIQLIGSENAIPQQSPKSTEYYTESLKKQTEAYNVQTEKVKQLIAIRDELNSKEGISSKSLQDITEKYHELIPYLNNEAKLREKLTELIVQEEDTQKSAYANMIMYSQEFFNAKIKGNTNLVNELNKKYGIDLENYKSLAEAKDAVEQKLIQGISSKWGSFYDAQTNSFSDTFDAFRAMAPAGIVDQVTNQLSGDMSKITEARNRFKNIALDLAPVNFKTINLGNIKTEQGKQGTSRSELQEPEALIEKDRYFLLNQELNKTDALLNKIKAQEESAVYEKRVKLLDQEITLLKQKKINIHNITNEERKERNELTKLLKSQGMSFKGTGDEIAATNAQTVLDRSLNAVNAHRNDKNRSTYNKLKTQYENLTKAYGRFIDLQTKDIPKAGEDWNKLSAEISNVSLNQISLSFEKFNDILNDSNSRIAELEHRYKLLGDSNTSQKEIVANEILKAKQQQLNLINKKLIEYNNLLKKVTDPAQIEKYQEEIQKLKETSYSLDEDISTSILTIRNDAIEALKDSESKRHEQAIDDLDSELQKYQDYIDKKIKELDRLNKAEDYNREIASQDKDIQSKQNEINALALDNSAEAQARKAQLSAELLDLQTKKEDTVRDHTRDQEKELLNDLLDSKEKNIQNQKDLEDKQYNDFQNSIDKMLAGTTDFYNKQDNISKMSIDNVISYYENLNKTVGGVYDNLIAKLNEAKLAGLGNPITSETQFANSNTRTNKLSTIADSVKQTLQDKDTEVQMHTYLEQMGHNVEWKNGSVYIDNKKVDMAGSGIDNVDGTYIGTIEEIKRLLRKYNITFDQGGTASGKGFLFKDTISPERILSPQQTKIFDELVKNLPNLMKTIDITKSIIPNITTINPSSIVPKQNAINLTMNNTIVAPSGVDAEKVAEIATRKIFNKINTDLVLKGI